MSTDRQVHAVTADGFQIVRYGRAGKWYIEGSARNRERITVAMAVSLASTSGSSWREGVSGGSYFDAQVRKRRRLAATEETAG